jgi:hypothetical protein
VSQIIRWATGRKALVGFDLLLTSSANDAAGIPEAGKGLIIVAAVKGVLHLRIFDEDGKKFVDLDETKLAARAVPIDDVRQQLRSLWPPHVLTKGEKARVIDVVTSIVVLGNTPAEISRKLRLSRCGLWLSPDNVSGLLRRYGEARARGRTIYECLDLAAPAAWDPLPHDDGSGIPVMCYDYEGKPRLRIADIGFYLATILPASGEERVRRAWFSEINPDEVMIWTVEDLFVSVSLEGPEDPSGDLAGTILPRIDAQRWHRDHVRGRHDLPDILREVAIDPGPTGTPKGDRTRPTAAGSNAAGSDHQLTDLVTLDQCAAMVNRRKRTLENYKKTMPRPKVPGGGGKPHEYAWSEMRPWLERTFKRPLPPTHPDKSKPAE